MRIAFSFGWKALAIAFVVSIVVLAGAWGGFGYYTSQSSFCGGSCHIMEEQYAAWKDSKHYAPGGDVAKQASCIDCHFLPGEKRSFKAMMQGARHLTAYLHDRDAPLPIRPLVEDGSCLRSGCHATEKFQDKELKFGAKSIFRHKAHFEKEVLKGQKLFCETCHVKNTAELHFEVPKEICFTCHFRPDPPRKVEAKSDGPKLIQAGFDLGGAVDFTKPINQCALCHSIPSKSLQQQFSADDPSKKPITHQTLEQAKVPCESCHLHQVAAAAAIKTDECLDCHSATAELFSKGKDAALMHDAHVAGRRADCLDCHEPSRHGAKLDYLDDIRTDCVLCHADQHRYQKILLTGERVSEGLSPVPGLMDAVNTNCAACHVKIEHANGQLVKTGSGETCVNCHTPALSNMLDDWKQTLESEVAFIKEVETEALAALAAAEGKIEAEKLNEARETIAVGQELLNIVQFGNGVHNKKYAIMILDEAIANFEDTIDLLDFAQ